MPTFSLFISILPSIFESQKAIKTFPFYVANTKQYFYHTKITNTSFEVLPTKKGIRIKTHL